MRRSFQVLTPNWDRTNRHVAIVDGIGATPAEAQRDADRYAAERYGRMNPAGLILVALVEADETRMSALQADAWLQSGWPVQETWPGIFKFVREVAPRVEVVS